MAAMVRGTGAHGALAVAVEGGGGIELNINGGVAGIFSSSNGAKGTQAIISVPGELQNRHLFRITLHDREGLEWRLHSASLRWSSAISAAAVLLMADDTSG